MINSRITEIKGGKELLDHCSPMAVAELFSVAYLSQHLVQASFEWLKQRLSQFLSGGCSTLQQILLILS